MERSSAEILHKREGNVHGGRKKKGKKERTSKKLKRPRFGRKRSENNRPHDMKRKISITRKNEKTYQGREGCALWESFICTGVSDGEGGLQYFSEKGKNHPGKKGKGNKCTETFFLRPDRLKKKTRQEKRRGEADPSWEVGETNAQISKQGRAVCKRERGPCG